MKRIAVILLHVGYWSVYLILIVLFDVMASLTANHRFIARRFWIMFWHNPAWVFLAVPALLSFYLFYGILFSQHLVKKRLWLLTISGAGVSFLSAVVAVLLLRLAFGIPFNFSLDTGMALLALSVIALVNGVLALVMRGFISWYSEIRLKEELNRRNFEMELALVKSQISPHFLFNTLNNIDVLIGKDAVRASDYLKKLSDMLRFMLYETKTGLIPIGKELGHIEKYLELQRIRISNPAAIRYTVEGQAGRLMVEPMLFMPFIENAFKHAEKKGDDIIRIRFLLEEGRIVFDCENKYRSDGDGGGGGVGGSDREGHVEEGGLGNSLIRKRLSLLYPKRHSLEVRTENDIYQARLILNADAN